MFHAIDGTQFAQDHLGPLVYEQWKDHDKFVFHVEHELKRLAQELSVEKNYHFVNLHYSSPELEKTGYSADRMRLYIHVPPPFSDLYVEYENLIKLYIAQEAHFASLMVMYDWNKTLKFRLHLKEGTPVAGSDWIDLSQSIVNALLKISPDLPPDKFESQVGAIGDETQKDLDKVKDKLCSHCKRPECADGHQLLMKELYGTFNMTIGALQIKPLKGKLGFVDIIMDPIPIMWNNRSDVIAVMIGILRGNIDGTKPSEFVRTFAPVIQGIHHRELLFGKLDEQESALKQKMKKLLYLVDQTIQGTLDRIEERRVALDGSGKEQKLIDNQMIQIEKQKSEAAQKKEGIIKRILAAKTMSELQTIDGEIKNGQAS